MGDLVEETGNGDVKR